MIRWFLDKKTRGGFLPFYFVGEKPRGGKTLRGNFFFHLEAQYNAEGFRYTFYFALWWIIIKKSKFDFFKKPCGVFPPQSEMGEKPRGGNLSMELKSNINFLQTVQSDILISW